MWNKFLLLILALTTQSAFAWQAPTSCLEGQIKTVTLGKAEIERAAYCTNTAGSELLSQNCTRNTECEALRSKETLERKNLRMTAVGTPGFHLCTDLKGEGQIIEFTVSDKKWVKLDRCLFSDGSFIDVGSLLENTYKD